MNTTFKGWTTFRDWHLNLNSIQLWKLQNLKSLKALGKRNGPTKKIFCSKIHHQRKKRRLMNGEENKKPFTIKVNYWLVEGWRFFRMILFKLNTIFRRTIHSINKVRILPINLPKIYKITLKTPKKTFISWISYKKNKRFKLLNKMLNS